MQRVIIFGECMVELYQLVENVYHQNFAGDVFNTAVYLKRMQPALQVEFFSAIGTDLISDKLLAAVEAEKLGSQYLLRSKTARDTFGHRNHSALGGCIMPMRRAVAAIGGTTGDIDDPSFLAKRLPVQDRKTAKLGRSRQVDRHRPFPAIEPFDIAMFDRVGFKYAGIVDQHVNASAHFLQGVMPDLRWHGRIAQVAVRT